MRVLLLNPPSPSPEPILPLGLACLAAALERSGVAVDVVDAWAEGLGFADLRRRLSGLARPDIIGVSVMSPVYGDGMQTVQTARESFPGAKIIAGGYHPSSLPTQTLAENPGLDYVARGEADELIVQLARALTSDDPDLGGIPGLVHRGDDGQIVDNGCAIPVKDLDALPLPARHLFPMDRYRTHPPYRLRREYATMMTSRGCPYACTYCTKSVSGRNHRRQSAERILTEIDHLVSVYGIRQVHFYDDNFTIDKKRILALCSALRERRYDLVWSCVSRVNLVNDEVLAEMKSAGCWLISYGVESGNQAILDRVNKGYSLAQVRSAFRATRRAGIRSLGYFMAGFPGETQQTLDETVELSLKLDPDFVSWSITALYPGSELYQQAVDRKLGDNYKKLESPVDSDTRNVSSLSPYSHGHTFIFDGELSRDYVLKTVRRAYNRFYFRPRYLIRFLTRLRTLTELESYIKAFLQYVAWSHRA